MKRVLLSGILSTAMVVGYMHWRESRYPVYYLSVGSSFARSSAEIWHEFGMPPHAIRIVQRINYEYPERADKFTDFEMGKISFSVHADVSPSLVGLGYAFVLSGLFLMITTPKPKQNSSALG